ncbi:uncharacterized protein LOC120609268 isoform X1 [Pteropus medius]|uniref:uncharacterized protein LOC120609268 isoform X1 n=1 Tax=Pteropus vampyrus TaxID=132908 RepID=UPI00196AB3C9|nr:uncharacterized protein LOC120609268 isoform X1 [Pteropus giganteus]
MVKKNSIPNGSWLCFFRGNRLSDMNCCTDCHASFISRDHSLLSQVKRWRTVTPIGHPLPGTRFIAFKVPLKGAVNQRLTPTQKFTPKDLISAIKALNVELGLIIDLTYTTRYYEVKDLPKSIHYKKLYTVGLEVPDNATILQFKKWVRKFLWENAENDKLIGVHCTNGINRTGYLICRYLIDVEGWDPDTAIQAFGEARGHRIDGCVYLKDLKTQPMRSNLGMDVWDSDDDANPPSNSMEESRDWHPNEDFHGSGKRSRLLNDQHPQNGVQIKDYDYVNNGPAQRHRDFYEHQYSDNMPEERHLRDWDFSNKGPEPRCSFFANHQCYNVSQEETDYNNRLPGIRPTPFHDHQPHSDFYEADTGDDFDFVSKVCGKRRHSIQNHQAYSNFWEQFPAKDFGFVKRSQRQKRPFYNHHEYQDLLPVQGLNYLSRGGFQRQKPCHFHYSYDEMNLEGFRYTDEVSEHTLRPLHDHSNNDLSEKMPLKKYVNRGLGQRLPSFPKFQKQMQLRNFDFNNGTRPRQMSYCDHPPSDPQEQVLLEDLDFEQETSLQRPRSFQDHTLPDNINPDWYLDKTFGSDNCRGRSQRLICPEDSQRVQLSNGFNCWRWSGSTAYSSRGLPFSCVFQEDGSVDYYRGKNSRDMEQHKRSYF